MGIIGNRYNNMKYLQLILLTFLLLLTVGGCTVLYVVNSEVEVEISKHEKRKGGINLNTDNVKNAEPGTSEPGQSGVDKVGLKETKTEKTDTIK